MLEDIRCQLNLLLILLGLLSLLLNGLGRRTSAAFCNLLLRCSGILDGPFAGLVLELGGIPD